MLKKISYLIFITYLIFIGCSKKEKNIPAPKDQTSSIDDNLEEIKGNINKVKYKLKSLNKRDPFLMPYKEGVVQAQRTQNEPTVKRPPSFIGENFILKGVIESEVDAALLTYTDINRKVVNYILRKGKLIKDNGAIEEGISGKIISKNKVILYYGENKVEVNK